MADKLTDTPPDRLSLDPRSEHFDEALLEPRRRHQVQRPGKDQRHRIFDLRRLDPRRRRPQPRPLRPADDDQAQGQGRALFRESRSRARRRKAKLPKDRTGVARRWSRHFLNAQPPSASAASAGTLRLASAAAP